MTSLRLQMAISMIEAEIASVRRETDDSALRLLASAAIQVYDAVTDERMRRLRDEIAREEDR